MFDRLRSIVRPAPLLVQVCFLPLTAPIRTQGRMGYTYRWTLTVTPEVGTRVLVPVTGSTALQEGFVLSVGSPKPRGQEARELLDVRRVATAQDVTRSKRGKA